MPLFLFQLLLLLLLPFFNLLDFPFFNLLGLLLLETVRVDLVAVRIPGALVDGEAIPASALAGASIEEVGEVFGVDVLEQLLLVAGAEDLNFLLGLVVDPHLDDSPDPCEEHGGVDDEHARWADGYFPRISG